MKSTYTKDYEILQNHLKFKAKKKISLQSNDDVNIITSIILDVCRKNKLTPNIEMIKLTLDQLVLVHNSDDFESTLKFIKIIILIINNLGFPSVSRLAVEKHYKHLAKALEQIKKSQSILAKLEIYSLPFCNMPTENMINEIQNYVTFLDKFLRPFKKGKYINWQRNQIISTIQSNIDFYIKKRSRFYIHELGERNFEIKFEKDEYIANADRITSNLCCAVGLQLNERSIRRLCDDWQNFLRLHYRPKVVNE